MSRGLNRRQSSRIPSVLALASVLGAMALFVRNAAKHAEERQPPRGKFLTVDGVRLHYLDNGGWGMPVLLLHGNGVNSLDWKMCGLFEKATSDYRFIAIDRPGFGYSERPRGRSWTPDAQADLIAEVLRIWGMDRAIIVAHSMGTMVASALAIRHPQSTAGLVLISGYYFPTPRKDAALFSAPAVPIVGDILRYTISPLIGRILGRRQLRRAFAPQPVPRGYEREFLDLGVRPWQIRASSAEAAEMLPAAAQLEQNYSRIQAPTYILAGKADEIIEPEQSVRVHELISGSELRLLPGIGHMLHHANPEAVLEAIDAVHSAEPGSYKNGHDRERDEVRHGPA